MIEKTVATKFEENFRASDFIQAGIDDRNNGYVNYIMNITNCTIEEAHNIISEYDLYMEPPSQEKIAHVNGCSVQRESINIECPFCHSTKTSKITATTKAINTIMFGFLGNKRRYQWHCNNCKSDF